ncbi:MAG TPA: S9 family peptidase [Candidatus Acidoferrales bacterium]|nr:S9 family peptidase [Candidatus Acidoferrales bacterium]
MPDPSRLETLAPPVARREQHAAELHGDRRVDEYAWLREKSKPEVRAYLEAENAYADAVTAPAAGLREKLYKEMLGRIKQTDLTVPARQGKYFYYSRTQEGKQYSIWCRRAGSEDGPEEVMLDGNALAEGHEFFALGAYEVSDDGALLAYITDFTGFREYTLRVKDLRSGELLPDTIEHVTSLAWAADGRTLFYAVEDDAKRPHRVFRHRLGDSSDALVYEERDERFRAGITRSRSRAFLFLESQSHTCSEFRFVRADAPEGEWRLVAARQPEHEYEVDHHGDRLYIRSNRAGRNFALFSAPLADPRPENWTEVIPHRPAVMLAGMEFFAGHSVLHEREEGLPRIRVTDLRTEEWHRIEFPEPAYSAVAGDNFEFDTNTFRYVYESLVTPRTIFDYNLATRERVLRKQTEVLGGYDPAQYVTERLAARAADGTAIPISIAYRRGRLRDGSAPVLLLGYGSYGYPLPVVFQSNRVSLMDRGFAVALAHVRGGGEMGKPWHDQGRMLRKRNTFTDFVAAADFLVDKGYTSHQRLAIHGGSAGGLLIGATLNLRPDICRVAVMHVPFVDVLNSMLDPSLPLTVGEFEEWGNPQDPEQYACMRSYCPYTNLVPRAYPAMLLRTGWNDSQVMYWEPAKYTARLRTLKTDANPLLLKVNLAAGHGGASGRYDYLREVAFDYAFLLREFGILS